jgi:hypothetical protein
VAIVNRRGVACLLLRDKSQRAADLLEGVERVAAERQADAANALDRRLPRAAQVAVNDSVDDAYDASNDRAPRLPHNVADAAEPREGEFEERDELARAIENGVVELPAEEQRERPRAFGRDRDRGTPSDDPLANLHRDDQVEVVHAKAGSLRCVDVAGEGVEVDPGQGGVGNEGRPRATRGSRPIDDRQRRGLAARLLEVRIDADLTKPVLPLSAARLHLEDGGLEVEDAEPHPARGIVPLDCARMDEDFFPKGRRPRRHRAVGPPLEDPPDVRAPFGIETRVHHWIVEDETFEDGAPPVEPAQRDPRFHALRGQDLFLPVEDPHTVKRCGAIGDGQVLPFGRHRQPVLRPQIRQQPGADVPRRCEPGDSGDRDEHRARAERPADPPKPLPEPPRGRSPAHVFAGSSGARSAPGGAGPRGSPAPGATPPLAA